MLMTFVLAAILSAAPATGDDSDEPMLDYAVEQAAREFRIAAYERFRTTREEYDSRRAMGDELLKLWNKAEQPPRHRETVLAWFGEAARRTRAGQAVARYVQLEDLKSVTITEDLPEGEITGDTATKEIKLPPPFVLETPPGAVVPSEDESVWTRLKALFSAAIKPVAEASPTEAAPAVVPPTK